MDDECSDLGTGMRAICDEGYYCEKHFREAEKEHSWMAHVPFSVVTGVMNEEEEQDLRDAGRGHLLPP